MGTAAEGASAQCVSLLSSVYLNKDCNLPVSLGLPTFVTKNRHFLCLGIRISVYNTESNCSLLLKVSLGMCSYLEQVLVFQMCSTVRNTGP